MDLCGPMRVESINGKRYILVIVDDSSRYMWVYFLRSKDEAPKVIKTFLKKIQVLLQAPVIIVRTENGTNFKNQVLKEYFENVGISHQSSSVGTPQQNETPTASTTTTTDTTSTPTNLPSHAINTLNTSQNVDELEPQQHDQQQEDQPQLQTETDSAASSSQYVDPSNMHTLYQPYPHEYKWTKDHPLE
ncbi:retrovirus-related pol polyprotein from transposon TNT 1-94 [Tanacetum coccineum]